MERSFIRFCCIIFILGFIALAGCESEETTKIVPSNGIMLSVHPHTCVVRDSISETIRAVVRDMNNQPVASLPLTITLADTHAGEIRFFYETLRDTTDSRGEVMFSYVCRSVADNIITISARGVADSCGIRMVLIINDPPMLRVSVDPDTLLLSAGGADTAYVEIGLQDCYSVPIRNYQVYLSTNGGWLGYLARTDSLGKARTWWHAEGTFGTFYIAAFGLELTDTAWITVLP